PSYYAGTDSRSVPALPASLSTKPRTLPGHSISSRLAIWNDFLAAFRRTRYRSICSISELTLEIASSHPLIVVSLCCCLVVLLGVIRPRDETGLQTWVGKILSGLGNPRAATR